MATAQATAPTPPAAPAKPGKWPKSCTFHLPVHSFQANPKHKPQTWVVLTVPFRDVGHLVEAKLWNFLTGHGEQRDLNQGWVKKLYRDMRDGQYTPAPWSASVRRSHADKLVYTEEDGVTWVDLTVPSSARLAQIDGNHRDNAMRMLISFARTVLASDRASSEGKQEAQEIIDCLLDSDVTIKVYLDPNAIKANFDRLQKGRPLSRNEERMRRVRNRTLSPEKQPIADMAFAVTTRLARENRDSHLYQLVCFGDSATNLVGFDSITKDSGSELSCSIYAGADIAISHGRDAEWLEQCYVEAYRIVEDLTRAVELPTSDGKTQREIPGVLQHGKILCPLGSTYSGKRSGTTLLVGIGNLWAYYKILAERKQATPQDKERLAACVDEVFDAQFAGGLNAPLKRQLMGDFARALFEGFVLGEEEPTKHGKVAGDHGIPLPLLNFIPRSAFGIKKEPASDRSFVADDYNSLDDDMGGDVDPGDDGGTGKVTVSPGNRKALARAQQA